MYSGFIKKYEILHSVDCYAFVTEEDSLQKKLQKALQKATQNAVFLSNSYGDL